MFKRIFLTAVIAASVCAGPLARAEVWQPSPGHIQMPLWPGAIPDAPSNPKPEGSDTVTDSPVAGKPWVKVTDVSQPTLTVYPPKGENTGAAVVIFPGGGYQILAIDLEGTEVADWLNSKGITAIVLKYRVPHSGPYWDEEEDHRVFPKAPMALEDAQRAIRLVRRHAAEWHVDPHKIGVLGFSAGGHMVAGASTRYDEPLYAPVDAADKESCRPDFAVALYPGHLWANEDKRPRSVTDEKFELRPDLHVTAQTPPTFLVQGTKDDVDPVEESLAYYIALKRANVPVELHLYAQGGHAFGVRRTELPITRWTDALEAWLRAIGMTPH